MEINLSEKDMENLAELVSHKIENRVIGKLISSPSYDALSESAKRWATMFIDKEHFADEAVLTIKDYLSRHGEYLLRKIVMDAVREVNKDDPELKKIIANGIYQVALEHTQSLNPNYDE